MYRMSESKVKAHRSRDRVLLGSFREVSGECAGVEVLAVVAGAHWVQVASPEPEVQESLEVEVAGGHWVQVASPELEIQESLEVEEVAAENLAVAANPAGWRVGFAACEGAYSSPPSWTRTAPQRRPSC